MTNHRLLSACGAFVPPLILLLMAVLLPAGENFPLDSKAMGKSLRGHLDAPLLIVKRHAYMSPHIYDDYTTFRPGGGIYVIENPAAPCPAVT